MGVASCLGTLADGNLNPLDLAALLESWVLGEETCVTSGLLSC